jgi:hypothetical protein
VAKGGARNRSGPPAQEDSGRSERRGFRLEALPAVGFTGEVPEFPLPDASPRELVVWVQAWRTPQACAWTLPTEQWRTRTVALWVRLSVRCEQSDASPSLLAQLHRFADQIGMTTAGLAEMGWKITAEEPSAAEPAEAPEAEEVPERRLRAVGGA